MTLEDRIKGLILSKYKSLRDFTNNSGIDIPYTTIDGMLKRGIYNASINNVLKLCKTLEISADELAKGNIVPVGDDPIHEYAVMLANLSPVARANAIQYIKYLAEKEV